MISSGYGYWGPDNTKEEVVTTKTLQTKQALILERETNSSIELTRNAKGDYQWSVKLYFDEGESLWALNQLEEIDQQLRDTYLPKPEAPE